VHAADDIFQQAVLAALEHRSKFRESGHVLAWAIRLARHRAIDLTRRRQILSLPDEVLDQLETHWAAGNASGCSDRVEALHRCISRLSAPAHALLEMKYAQGLTAPRIASELHRSLDAVYQSLSRIHRWLRKCVARELGQLGNPQGGEGRDHSTGLHVGRDVCPVLGQCSDRHRIRGIGTAANG
jgi:RNA polymerase sigma factor (sigma-70 family)